MIAVSLGGAKLGSIIRLIRCVLGATHHIVNQILHNTVSSEQVPVQAFMRCHVSVVSMQHLSAKDLLALPLRAIIAVEFHYLDGGNIPPPRGYLGKPGLVVRTSNVLGRRM